MYLDSDSDDEMDTDDAEGDTKDAHRSNNNGIHSHTAPSLFGEDLEGSEDGVADKDQDESVSPTDAVRLIKELLKQAASRKEKGKEKGEAAVVVADADADDRYGVIKSDVAWWCDCWWEWSREWAGAWRAARLPIQSAF